MTNDRMDISITLTPKVWKHGPYVRWGVDDYRAITTTELKKTETSSMQVFLTDEKPHYVWLEMLHKKPRDTEVNEAGEITNDILVTIDALSFNGLEIGQIKYEESEYYLDHSDEVLRETLTLGFNGLWKLRFYVPTSNWIESFLNK
mgnify:CR=1 FL=1